MNSSELEDDRVSANAVSDASEQDDALEQDDAVIGQALKWSAVALLAIVAFAVGAFAWFSGDTVTEPGPDIVVDLPAARGETSRVMPTVSFVDITSQAGITFVHENGAYGDKMLPETMGGGCAFLDFDNDGDQDLLLVNSNHWPFAPESGSEPAATMALYANDGQGNFSDATAAAGLNVSCYGMGAAVADYDNDGDSDLFITAVGMNHLYRNDDGVFVSVTEDAGVAGDDTVWSSSAGWMDYDNDGDLDLYVCNYVKWSREIDLAQDFKLTGIGRAYGPPTSFQGSFPYFYRNEGDGTFTDVSAECGVQQTNRATGVPLAKSLGLAPIDLDRDGWLDLVVANDTVRNFVFHNNGDGTFSEMGIPAGIAFDSSGKARGAMGIDASCFRDDGSVGVAIANFANEMTALYVSAGNRLLFTDDAIPTGLGPPTRAELSFGLFFFDYDLDGRLDLLSANGHLESDINKVQESQQYQQPARLFWNAGYEEQSEFVSVPAEHCGSDFGKPIVGRGAAYADIDADGDIDVLLTQTGGPPLLLRNDQNLGNHFIRLRLVGSKCNRDAIGAWIQVRAGDRVLRRQVMPTRSYLSQVELPVTIGLGETSQIDELTIEWPDGSSEIVSNVRIDAETTVTQP